MSRPAPNLPSSFPMTLGFYFGQDWDSPGEPKTVTFSNPQEVDAFFHGLNESDGWLGYEVLPHERFFVNKHGEVQERTSKTAPKKVEGCACHVLWGESPEVGAKPDTYVFATQGEKDAFIDAVGAMVGESKYFCVPGPEFKPWVKDDEQIEESRQKLLDLVDPEYHAYVLKTLEEERYPIGGCGSDPIFIRRDGAFVAADWGPFFAIEDEPKSPEAWSQEFRHALQEEFGQVEVQLEASDEEALSAEYERDPVTAARDYGMEQGLWVRSSNRSPKP